MIEKMDSLKRTVQELFIGIVVFGVLFEITGLLFVKDKLAYSIGILCGVLIAIGLAIHMAHSLNDALDRDEENARRIIRKGTSIRYGAVILIILLLAYLKIGNILSCFLGIMTLKAAAYAQPYVHKLLNKIFHIEEGGCENAVIDDDDELELGKWTECGFYDSWIDRL